MANSLKRNEIIINMIFRETFFFGWYTWFSFFIIIKCHCEISLECKGSMYLEFILLIFLLCISFLELSLNYVIVLTNLTIGSQGLNVLCIIIDS